MWQVKNRVDEVMENWFNVSIIAYGQTGSGKTYTMTGPDEVIHDFATAPEEKWGLIPRAAKRLFDRIHEKVLHVRTL